MSADAAGAGAPVHVAGILADRIAAALVHREPGWRLPRRSALARRYNVSLGEIDVAIGDLTRRSLVRQLPDGQLYRASPAEYWIPVEGAVGLGTRLDPMGSAITCQARHASLREAPQDVAWALGLPFGAFVQVVRCVWVADGAPAATSTAYLPESAAIEDMPQGASSFSTVLNTMPGTIPATGPAVGAGDTPGVGGGADPGSRAGDAPGRLASHRASRRRQRRDVAAAALDSKKPSADPEAGGHHGTGQVR